MPAKMQGVRVVRKQGVLVNRFYSAFGTDQEHRRGQSLNKLDYLRCCPLAKKFRFVGICFKGQFSLVCFYGFSLKAVNTLDEQPFPEILGVFAYF